MTSAFIEHHTRDLEVRIDDAKLSSEVHSLAEQDSEVRLKYLTELQSLLFSLKSCRSSVRLEKCLQTFACLEQEEPPYIAQAHRDSEELVLKRCIGDILALRFYSKSLEIFLNGAIDAEAEAEWWADVERSRVKLSMYLLQTFPSRTVNLVRDSLHTLRSRGLPLRASNFREIFFPQTPLRPTHLLTSLFPHLKRGELRASLLFVTPSHLLRRCIAYLMMPIELTRQECKLKRTELLKVRDDKAENLGGLVEARHSFIAALDGKISMRAFVLEVLQRVSPKEDAFSLDSTQIIPALQLLSSSLSSQPLLYRKLLEKRDLIRPSRLALVWPRILVFPPLFYFAIRALYAHRATFVQALQDAKETVVGFITGWLVEPLKGVIKTIRAGGEEGVIVQKEAVIADLHSLERMTLSLAKDKLKFDAQQLQALSEKIRVGDLTPVLEIYERDIKSPLKSAIAGTLLRSIFIQVQKAKVDIDQALTGIDKLLKSQELTFAFVGVAPALAIVYLLASSVKNLIVGQGRKTTLGGSKRRKAVWADMRRIERLLISLPQHRPHHEQASSPMTPLQASPPSSSPPSSPPTQSELPHLTTGLLVISLTRLRDYAVAELPERGGLREGFLEDVGDLEDVKLGRVEKVRVVERMWRCWGGMLGWRTAGAGVWESF